VLPRGQRCWQRPGPDHSAAGLRNPAAGGLATGDSGYEMPIRD
jgi:hypothetical protein